MSKAPGPIVLTVALSLLILGTVALAYFFPSVPDLTSVSSLEPKGHGSKKVKSEDLDAGVEIWTKPVMWMPNSHRFFNANDYLFFPSAYPTGNYIQKLGEEARLPSGVLISWYKKNGIDITSNGVDRDDPDNDGFSNIAEFKNEGVGEHIQAADCDGTKSTNPNDPQSHPSFLSRLRLKEYERKPFHLRFNSYSKLNGIDLFQIKLTDLPSDRQPALKKTGDKLGVEDYIVGEFKEVVVEEMDPSTHLKHTVDRSTLEIIKPTIELHVLLPFQQDTDSPESTADFVMLMPADTDKVLKVPVGKILSVPYLKGDEAQFLVMDAGDKGSRVRNLKTKQDFQIPKLAPTDWDDVPVPPAGNATKTP